MVKLVDGGQTRGGARLEATTEPTGTGLGPDSKDGGTKGKGASVAGARASIGGRSLTAQQIVAVIRVSLLALLAIATASFCLLLYQERVALTERTHRLAEAVLPGMEQVVWNLDYVAGDAMVSSLLGFPDLRSVRIDTPAGAVFSQAARTGSETEGMLAGIGTTLFGDQLRRSVPILHQEAWPLDAAPERIGTLHFELDAAVVTRRFLGVALLQGIQLLFGSLVLASAIAWVVHRLVTRPLTQLGSSIGRIDPEDPDRSALTTAPEHAHNELGALVGNTNRLLQRLGVALDALRAMASTDDLTGLPNRAALIEAVSAAIGQTGDPGGRLAVLFLDLDDFKQVNDSFGHEVGDQILCEIARRLRAILEERPDAAADSLVGRLGGDEFVVLLQPLGTDAAAAEMAEAVLAAVTRRIEAAGHGFRISGSVGIALYPEHGATFSSLFRAADTAMYASKAERRGGWRYFDAAMTTKALARLRLEASLRDALEKEAFELFYQPQVDAATRRVVGCESLLRWVDAGQAVPPDRFIPIAESTQLIVPIGAWAFRTAGRQASTWRAMGFPGRVSVNVSPLQLERPEKFLEILDQLIQSGEVDPALMEIEVTESAFMERSTERTGLLDRLRAMGFTVGLDDFGTGYSCLAQLQSLPIDTLKVDHSFTRLIPNDPRIAKVVLALTAQLGLRSVAEGIETEAQERWLRDNGCQVLQGFLFAPALSVAAFEDRFLAPAA